MTIVMYWKDKIKVEQKCRLNNVNIYTHPSTGDAYSTAHMNLGQSIPAWMVGLYSELGFCETFTRPIKRGLYKFKSAKAKVCMRQPERDGCSVNITGRKLTDMFDIYNLICSGDICPVENWGDEPISVIQYITGKFNVLFYCLKKCLVTI